MVTFNAAAGRLALTMTAQPMGKDVNVSLCGGDAPHIGAVALARPRESLKGDGAVSATCSVLAVCGHKEDELARHVALTLAAKLNVLVCVACGIHLDSITPGEMAQVPVLVERLLEKTVQYLAGVQEGSPSGMNAGPGV